MKREIPRKTPDALLELSKVLSGISGGGKTVVILRHFLEVMNSYPDYFFSEPWPKDYDFFEDVDAKDLNFITRGGKDEFVDRLDVVCLKKSINLVDGFSPVGFFWTYWTLIDLVGEGSGGNLGKVRDDPAVFAEALLGWHPFPYQEKLLGDRSKRIVSCWGRQCGKTSTIAVKAIHFAYCNQNVNVLIASPSLRQSMIMYDRIVGFIYGSSILSKGVARKTRTVIQLLNGSRIIALPCSENLLRGYTAHLVICDESAFMPEEVIVQVVFPMLSTTDGNAVFLSTPWGRDHFFYRAFMDPNYSVHHVKSTECPLIKPLFLEEQRRNMSDAAFRMEYLAEFVEGTSCFFPQDLIRSCIDSELEFISGLETQIPGGEYYGGVDFGKLEDYSVIAVLKRKGDVLKLVFLWEFSLGTPYSSVIGFLVRADQRFRFRRVFVDQTGVGEPVLEELKRQNVENVKGLTFTVKIKEELLTCMKIGMEQRRLKMPYHRRLCGQINEQKYEYSKSGHLMFSHPVGSHDDLLWSLALGCYAATIGYEPSSQLMRAW